MLKVVLSHDVDRIDKTFQYLSRLTENLKQIKLAGFHYWFKNIFCTNTYFRIKELLEIEDKYGVKSTFFFLHETLPFNILKISNWPLSLGYYRLNDPRLKKIYPLLLSGGWEIGLHGSYSSFANYELLVHEKRILEDAIELEVCGVRQHFLNLSEKTWSIQSKAGFKYDASWGYTNKIGFKDGIYKEFTPLPNKDFKVVPLAVMDFCVMKMDDYMPGILKIIEECIANDGVLVINWHQRTFNEFEFPDYGKTYEELIRLCKSYNATFYTLKSYLNRNE